MRKEMMEVINHHQLASQIFELTLQGSSVADINKPGQFIHIKVDDSFDLLLRRPISIAEFNLDEKWMKLIYRVDGAGTKRLSQKEIGEKLDILGPLGNGFSIDEMEAGDHALIVGGGIGVPPLYELSKQLVNKGISVTHVLGFQSGEAVFYEERFNELGQTWITTVDGTHGEKGFVTDVLKKESIPFKTLYTCGPSPMLRAIEDMYPAENVYISLEERMGCGIGACFACVCPLKDDERMIDYRKVCTDGPVFRSGEVMY